MGGESPQARPLRVLLVKTSSLGDVIHTLPALTDAQQDNPGIRFDWLVEESFSEIPGWHPAVDRVLQVAIRRWRRSPLRAWRSTEMRALRSALRSGGYDCIIDAQGLLKSVWLTRLHPAPTWGYDRQTVREGMSSLFYTHKVHVPRTLHAVERSRRLFAAALGYPLPVQPPVYNLVGAAAPVTADPYVLLLHGTTWDTKHYPEAGWRRVIELLKGHGLRAVVTWGNAAEEARANRLAAEGALLLPRQSLAGLASAIRGATGVISVDTGLGHLAAALAVPVIGLYGPTDPGLSGIYGPAQESLAAIYPCSPCMRRRCQFAPVEGKSAAPGALQAFDPPCWGTLSPEAVVDALLQQRSQQALQASASH